MGRDAVLWCVSTVCPWLLYVTLFFLVGISEVFREVDWDVFVEDYPISSIIPPWFGRCGWDVSRWYWCVLPRFTTAFCLIVLFVDVLDNI